MRSKGFATVKTLWWKPWWGRLSPWSTCWLVVNQISTLKDSMMEQVVAPKGCCDVMENPCWSRLLTGPVNSWRERTPHQSLFVGRTCDPVGESKLEKFVPEGLHPVEMTSVKCPCWCSAWRTTDHRKDPCWRSSWRTAPMKSMEEQGKSMRKKKQ